MPVHGLLLAFWITLLSQVSFKEKKKREDWIQPLFCIGRNPSTRWHTVWQVLRLCTSSLSHSSLPQKTTDMAIMADVLSPLSCPAQRHKETPRWTSCVSCDDARKSLKKKKKWTELCKKREAYLDPVLVCSSSFLLDWQRLIYNLKTICNDTWKDQDHFFFV